ncbi:hypothetical protein BDA96_03G311100 [Sorghum bicolor]|uniref:Uncharacterized protein n=1 Tax=Sorghum bicolor TaxID=4558 RepID=A0A921RGN1_SORBI|nr:hypothetical protein BDA96_03G311100 [Sorghum bicolor]
MPLLVHLGFSRPWHVRLTAAFVGMTFTIQFVRKFAHLSLHLSVGGVLAFTLTCELSPVITTII